MVRTLTPEEYQKLFQPRPAPPAPPAPPVPPLATNRAAPKELTDEELELIKFEGYTRKFVRTEWQNVDIFHLLHHYDGLVKEDYHRDNDEKPKSQYGLANWSEMGCIAGDEKIVVNRGSSVRYWSIREAYYGFNRLNSDKRKNWKSDEPYRTHAFIDGRIRHHEIQGISFTGIKPTLRLTFSDGRSIQLTHDHLLLKPDGDWIEAQDVSENDYLVVRGRKGEKHNSDRTNRHYTYLKESYPGATRVVVEGNVYFKIATARLVSQAKPGELAHHKDETKWNDVPSNIQLMTLEEHSRLHARDQIASYDAPPMQVTKIEEAGETDVYDLHMESPYHNFVAGGVVVHNCYKTSTGLWLIQRLLQEAAARNLMEGPKLVSKFPSILIISSKGGKGTFLEAIPEILPEFTILNIETQALFYYKDGHMLKLDKSLKFVPKEFAMPTICLAHYDIFSRSNFGKFETDPETDMPLKLDGKFMFKPWTQADYIIDHHWDAVWCDEFHRLKDRDSRWTVNIKKVKAGVVKHGSTGTGFINRPDEIWSLLNFLQKEKYGSYWDFREEFCNIDDWDGYAKMTGCKPEMKDKFRKIVREIGVRRTLDEVMPDIKTPMFQPITVELNPTQRKMYDAIKSELQTLDENGTPLYAANVLSLLQRLRQICVGTPEVVEDYYDPIADRRIQKIKLREPSSKLDALMEVLEGLQWDDEKKEPLVVFSNFKDPLELFKARLDKHNQAAMDMGLDYLVYKYIHLDVGDSDIERYHKWHDEFPKLEHRVFMSTLQLGGESINLTPARHIVFLDRSWSPKDNAQGIGRIRRPGQKGQPVVIHINALKTTDQYIEHVNDVKHGWFTQIFGDEIK